MTNPNGLYGPHGDEPTTQFSPDEFGPPARAYSQPSPAAQHSSQPFPRQSASGPMYAPTQQPEPYVDAPGTAAPAARAVPAAPPEPTELVVAGVSVSKFATNVAIIAVIAGLVVGGLAYVMDLILQKVRDNGWAAGSALDYLYFGLTAFVLTVVAAALWIGLSAAAEAGGRYYNWIVWPLAVLGVLTYLLASSEPALSRSLTAIIWFATTVPALFAIVPLGRSLAKSAAAAKRAGGRA